MAAARDCDMLSKVIPGIVVSLTSKDAASYKNKKDDTLFVVLVAAYSALHRDDRCKINDYIEGVVPGYLPEHFRRMFRVSHKTFGTLLLHLSNTNLFHPKTPAGRTPVSIEKILLMSLWYLGSTETVKSISDRFNVQETTFVSHNRKLLSFFSDVMCKKFIVWPRDCQKADVMRDFEEMKGFPGVLGAIDGTHISIKSPCNKESDYINRKGFHSVILQAICKRDRMFTDIYCGWPGRVHDARVYRNSPFFENQLAFCGQNHIIGDGAYPLSSFLMKPYRDNGNLTQEEKQFNKSICGTRSVIENAFGILKGRFRRLQHISMNEIEYIVKAVTTTCVLHNICIMNGDELEEHLQNLTELDDAPVLTRAQDDQGVLKRRLITRQISNR